ncbi:Tryptophan--tRNA ligase 2 [compost metagenome]
MSKSLGNAIFLSDPPDVLRKKVRQVYTDPTRLRATDPGHLEGNVVFEYLDAFDPDRADLEALKERYQAGGIGDVAVKDRLFEVLDALLAPFRERRARWEQAPDEVDQVLQEGSERARAIAVQVLTHVRDAMGLPLRL